MLRVCLIGRIAIEVDGHEVALPPGRPTELLAWLAAHPGLHPRSRLAPLFWPDVPDATSRASLRTALWALRKALGPPAESVLVSDRAAVGLDGEGLLVDLRSALETDSADTVLRVSTDDVLPGIEAEWADNTRADHTRAVLAAIEAVERRAETQEDHELMVAAARRLTEIDPLSEERHRLYLRRLHAVGETGAALKEHEAFRSRLWEELRVRPSDATRKLVRQIATAPHAPDLPDELPGRLARADAPVFVGREGDCAALLDMWAGASQGGGPRLALVSGEPGIGKSCLAARVANDVFGSKASVLYGAAAEDALLPAEPFLEAIGEHHAVPADQLIDLVHQRIVARAAERPALLVLDDFHWADRVSFALLRRLARSDTASCLAILVLYRPEPASQTKFADLVGDLSSRADLVRIDLGPLSSSATSSLLDALDPGGGLSARTERIHADTGGNPLFIHELGRYLLEAPPDQASAVPPTVRDLVVGRLQRVSNEAEVVAGASVLGHRSQLAVLRHMALTSADPLGELEEAVALGLMEEESAGVHVFRHALVRNSIYDSLSLSRRAQLHRRAADAIRAVHGEAEGPHLCDIASHRCAASPPDSPSAAVADAKRAGRWAIDHHAYERAVVVLTKALALAGDDDRRELAVARAVAYQRLTHVFIDSASSPAG